MYRTTICTVTRVTQDDKDEEVEMSLMTRKKDKYQWPSEQDITWVTYNDILGKLQPSVPSGKTRRMYI